MEDGNAEILSGKILEGNLLWNILIAETVVIAFFSLFIAAISDSFHYDDYALMKNIGNPFWEYANATFSWSYFPTTIHYWVSDRFFGHNLISYRIFPFISYLLTLGIVIWGSRKIWRSPGIMFFLVVALSFNNFLLYHAGHSVITFANDIFLGCSFYYIFLQDSQHALTARQWMIVTVFLMPFAFFSNVIVVIPIFAGIITTIFLKYIRSRNDALRLSVPRTIWRMKPVFLIPLMQLVISTIFVNRNLGIEKRPDLADLFFPSSHFSQDIGGFVQFVSTNLYSLGGGLLAPRLRYPIGFDLSPGIRCFFLLLTLIVGGLLIYGTFFKSHNTALMFTELFCGIAISGMILGSFFGVYPFGNARYAGYLLIPLLVLPGYAFSLVFNRFLEQFSTYQNSILIVLILFIALGGGALCYQNFINNRAIQDQNSLALQAINTTSADVILFSPYIEPVFSEKCPQKYAGSISMGWGSFFGFGSDGGISLDIQAQLSDPEMREILVIASNKKGFTTEYPSWNNYLNMNFQRVSEKQYPAFWLGMYEKNSSSLVSNQENL